MYGAIVFNNIFNNLGEKCRNKVLGNIFGLTNVSISNLVIRDNSIIFRIFSDKVFYQYIFNFCYANDDYFIKVSCSKNIVNSIVFVDNCSEELELLIKIFKCWNEEQIYRMMKKFL